MLIAASIMLAISLWLSQAMLVKLVSFHALVGRGSPGTVESFVAKLVAISWGIFFLIINW